MARFPAELGDATDLALATGLGAGLLEPRRCRACSSSPTARRRAATCAPRPSGWRRAASPCSRSRCRRPAAGDVAVEALTATDDVRQRAPFSVEVRLLANRATTASASTSTARAAPWSTTPKEGRRRRGGNDGVTFVARVEQPGVRRSALASWRRADATPRTTPASSPSPPRATRASCSRGRGRAAAPFARALGTEHIAVDVRAAAGFPRAPLDRYDLVVLSDVARAELGDKRMAALDAFVRAGGGLLVAGGAKSFGSGGYGARAWRRSCPCAWTCPKARTKPRWRWHWSSTIGLDGRPQDGADQGSRARDRRDDARRPT